MSQVFVLPHARFNAHFTVMLDEAVVASEVEESISVVYCDGVFRYCRANVCASKLVCRVCKSLAKLAMKKLPEHISVYKLGDFIEKEQMAHIRSLNYDFSSIDELKSINYNGVDIGYSVLSFYVMLRRNLFPEFNHQINTYFNDLLRVAANMSHVVENIDIKLSPDTYSVFNGRLFDTRSFIRKPILLGKQVKCFETEDHPPTWEHKSVCFLNTLPHDIEENANRYQKFWAENISSCNESEMKDFTRIFYENRRNGQQTIEKTIFVNDQVDGCLPREWNENERNFVFFNSSEDEYAGIDKEYDSYKFLPNQIDIIRKVSELASQLDNSIRIYLRIHPNLKNVKHSYHSDLSGLDGLNSNIIVIAADSPISTYELIHRSEKVLVVGSTVGIEAVYARKPVILLGPSFYRFLGGCYLPKSDEELKELLACRLEPLDIMAAYQYGFYKSSVKGRKWKYFNFGRGARDYYLGVRIPAVDYFTLFGSFRLFGLLYKIFVDNLLLIPFYMERRKTRNLGIYNERPRI